MKNIENIIETFNCQGDVISVHTSLIIICLSVIDQSILSNAENQNKKKKSHFKSQLKFTSKEGQIKFYSLSFSCFYLCEFGQ